MMNLKALINSGGGYVYAVSDFLNERLKPCNIVVGFIECSREKEQILREHRNCTLYMIDVTSFHLTGEWSMAAFYEGHKSEFLKIRNELCDEESKTAFDLFIEQRCSLIYRKPCSNKTEYFDDDIVTLEEDEVFVDCGAYDGDTVRSFINCMKAAGISKYEKIYAFEADVKNCQKCAENLSQFENIEVISKGVYDKDCELFFDETGTMGSAINENSTFKIEATSIDEAVSGRKVTFIKMDIEGAELKALQGAEETIRRYRPKLAVCVYHKAEDLITIPQYIKNLDPTYRLYLRSYWESGFDTILYAV